MARPLAEDQHWQDTGNKTHLYWAIRLKECGYPQDLTDEYVKDEKGEAFAAPTADKIMQIMPCAYVKKNNGKQGRDTSFRLSLFTAGSLRDISFYCAYSPEYHIRSELETFPGHTCGGYKNPSHAMAEMYCYLVENNHMPSVNFIRRLVTGAKLLCEELSTPLPRP